LIKDAVHLFMHIVQYIVC